MAGKSAASPSFCEKAHEQPIAKQGSAGLRHPVHAFAGYGFRHGGVNTTGETDGCAGGRIYPGSCAAKNQRNRLAAARSSAAAITTAGIPDAAAPCKGAARVDVPRCRGIYSLLRRAPGLYADISGFTLQS